MKRTKLLDKNVDVIAKLLSHIEPFPFDPHFNPSNRPPKNQQIVTIKKIRDSVEKQYLAWKLDVDVNVIIKVLSCYKRCLTEGRSVRSIQRNIQSINEEPKVCNENVSFGLKNY